MSDTITKVCNCCKRAKPLEEFQRSPRTPDGRRNVCKTCCTIKIERTRAARKTAADVANTVAKVYRDTFAHERRRLRKQITELREERDELLHTLNPRM
jgi:hypothetical protein